MNHFTICFHRILGLLLALTWIISSLAVSAKPAAAASITAPPSAGAPADGPEFPNCSEIPPQSPCNLQVFLLIDDSSSMLYTDPTRQRLEGVKNALDILAKEYYLPAVDANAKDPSIELPNIQVSLIRFSSVVRHNSGWKTINPGSIVEWLTQLETFDDDLTVEIDYTRPPFTDFRTAFQAATELAADKPQTSDCHRLVMLFTDGIPNLGNGNLEDGELDRYMEALQQYIIQPTFNRRSDLLFVTAFGSDQTFRNYWDREYKQEWEEITGDEVLDPRRVLYVPAQELAAHMERIIVSTIGDQVYTLTPISGEPQQYTTEIPITVESLRLTYYAINPNANFTVTGPDSNIIQPDGKNIILTGANTSIQVLEILKPAPGAYQITTTVEGGLLTQLLRFEKITAKLSSPIDPWLQFTNGQIGIQLFGADDKPLTISPQMSIQAALTQAGQPNNLALTPGSDTFTTNWLPLTTDKATVHACATLQDDKGMTIVLHNGPVGEIQIDPVTVQAGQAEKACVPSEKVVNVPLQLINGRSQQPVTIDPPVQWIPSLSSAPSGTQLDSTIEEIDAKTGKYVLRFKPASAGDVTFAMKTDAIVDGTHHTFYDDEITPIEIEPPRQLALTLGEPDTLGDQFSVLLYQFFHPSCINDDTKIVIGRRIFGWFGVTPVQINGRHMDTGTKVNEPGIERFAVQLVSTNGGPTSEMLSSWTAPETSDDFSTLAFRSPGLGLYAVTVTDQGKNLECTELDSLPTQTLLLINDFWEYVIILALILFLALLVLYLLRRYRERRYSHDIPLILSSIVLIILNIILVNLLLKHTFECQFKCSFLTGFFLETNTLCTEGFGIPPGEHEIVPSLPTEDLEIFKITIIPKEIIPAWTLQKNTLPLLHPLARIIDPKLEDLRPLIIRTIIVFIALASLVTAFILKRLLTPEGHRAILTYLGWWLLFFVILCSLFYYKFVK